MNELKQIDEVLKYILQHDFPPRASFTDIKKALNYTQDDTKVLIEILNKLEKDGYITPDTIKGNTGDIKYYFSSFEGRLFVKNGGYLSNRTAIEWQKRYIMFRAIMDIINIIAIIVLTVLIFLADICYFK